MWYALVHKETGRFLGGTNFNYDGPEQVLSEENFPPMLFDGQRLEHQLLYREIDPQEYDVVEVELQVKAVRQVEVTDTRSGETRSFGRTPHGKHI